MTNTQSAVVAKYVARYPHLKTLATNAESDRSVVKTLGDQIARLAAPPDVSGIELLEVSKLGLET